MNIILEKNILEKLLINAQPFLEKKDFSQITSHILIQAHSDKLEIKSTDYEVGIILEIKNATIKEAGSATANGKKILDIIKHLQNQEVKIYTEASLLVIEQGSAEFKIPMFTPEEFPSFPSLDEKNKISLNQINLLRGLRQALPSVDTNNPKYELNGTLINFEEEHYDIVSTDTKRLSIISFKENIKKNIKVIISKKSSIELQKIIHQESDIFFNESNLIVKNENIFFFTKLINSEYPDYKKIVPQNIQHRITLKKQDILNALQMILPLSNIVSISFSKKSIRFTTSPEAQSQAKVDVQTDTDLEDFSLNVTIRYLIDFLLVIDSEEFLLELNEENLPFTISSENYKKIIMPVII